ncbi:MAG: hypothetical protein WBB82_11200 [Limnothrix sp.]
MISHPSLSQILWELEQHQDAARIKKLLIYTSENRWESDPQSLEQRSLEQIVSQIYLQLPSAAHLLEALTTAVSTLSRPAAYSFIATEIVTKLSPLYDEPDEATHIVATPPPIAPAAQVSGQVIEYVSYILERHREAIRIKKLLFALCYQRWENDFQVLGQISFTGLLQKLKGHYATKTAFESTLQQLIASLNHQVTYSQIGADIIESIRPMYESTDERTGITRPTFPPIEVAAPDSPPTGTLYKGSMVRGNKASSVLGHSQAHLITDPATAGNPKSRGFTTVNPPASVAAQYKQTMTDRQEEEATKIAGDRRPTEPKKVSHFMDDLDIYQLKLEIMKYTNPLRVKILLFSIVHHPFDLSGQDWSMLRACDFDILLRKVTDKAPSITELEIKLSAIAQSLFEPNEHLQATSAIVQSINLLQNAVKSPAS